MATVKSYIANTQKEAFDKIKEELGEEAIIINTRKVRRKGFFGFFKKPMVEMTAVADDFPKDNERSETREKNEIQSYIKETFQNDKLERIEKQINQVNELVNRVYDDVDWIKRKELSDCSGEFIKMFETLVLNDIIEENALKLTRLADEQATEKGIELKSAMKDVLTSCIGETSYITLDKGKKNIVFFVGPTGVGKTTTLAKIAATFSLKYDMRVSLITEDTYRIGAVEQLKIYADILNLQLDVVYSPEEIKEKVNGLENVDLILVDTAGKNTTDKAYKETINKMIKSFRSKQVHLVISATTGYSTLKTIVESYSFLKDYKIILTKLDECNNWGMIINLKMLTDKPLSYLTVGQNVAEDILIADPKTIITKILEREVDYGPSLSTT